MFLLNVNNSMSLNNKSSSIDLAISSLIQQFNFDGVHLYNLSLIDGSINCVFDMSIQGKVDLQIYDNINNLFFVKKSINEKKPLYISGSEFYKLSPKKYLQMDCFKNAVCIVPILYRETAIGYICPYNYGGVKINNSNILHKLLDYSYYMGTVIMSNHKNIDNIKITPRECQVLQFFAYGFATKQVADILGISEFTVNDYIKLIVKKMNVKNKIEAITTALRNGYII